MSQSSYFKSRPDLATYARSGEELEGETLRVERLGCNLVGRISKCRRHVIDVTGLDPLSLGELGGSCALASLLLLDVLGR